jgi:hypothetical protein
MSDTKADQAAVATGRRMAEEVVALRAEVLALRMKQLGARYGAEPMTTKFAVTPPVSAPALTKASAGWLVAEGDSWFAWGRDDILATLQDPPYNFEVESVARLGDGLEDMASQAQIGAFCATLEKMLRFGVIPSAILVSGGGNDVVKQRLDPLLNRAEPGVDPLNEEALKALVDQTMRGWLITIMSQVTTVCDKIIHRRIPILVHGYDYPVPDGRFVVGGPHSSLSWLYPGLKRRGYVDLEQNKVIMQRLIDRLNVMLMSLPAVQDLAHVQHVDLRSTLLRTEPDYRLHWSNELHPTATGFGLITAKVAHMIPPPPA